MDIREEYSDQSESKEGRGSVLWAAASAKPRGVTDEEYTELVKKLEELEAEEERAGTGETAQTAQQPEQAKPLRSILKKPTSTAAPPPVAIRPPGERVKIAAPAPAPVISATTTVGSVVERNVSDPSPVEEPAPEPRPARVSRFKAAREAQRQME